MFSYNSVRLYDPVLLQPLLVPLGDFCCLDVLVGGRDGRDMSSGGGDGRGCGVVCAGLLAVAACAWEAQ